MQIHDLEEGSHIVVEFFAIWQNFAFNFLVSMVEEQLEQYLHAVFLFILVERLNLQTNCSMDL